MYEFEQRKLKKYLGEDLYNTFKNYNCIVAGGSILSIFSNRDINDVDVYFQSKEDLAQFLYYEMKNEWIISYTDKAILYNHDGINIQLIYFQYFDNVEDLFNTFDFTVCMGSYDFGKEEFILHEDFLRHNVSRILKFNQNTAYPIVSALRVQKYKDKGFSISKPEYIKILLTIMNLKIDNYEDLKAQMGGMYGENYDTLLKPKEDEEFDLIKIIDNISKIGESCEEITYNTCSIAEFDSDEFDEFIRDTFGVKRSCFKYEDKYFEYIGGNFVQVENKDLELYDIKDMNKIVKFPLKLYKYVFKKDNKYYSFHDNNYEWKLGDFNYPKSSNNYVYACKYDQLKKSTFKNKSNKICIEVECESFEDVRIEENWCDCYKSNNSYKRLKFIKEV